MKRNIIYNIAAWLMVCAFAFASALIITHQPRQISELENRELAQLPVPSWDTVLNGTFMDRFEAYATDQFRWRDAAVSLKADAERAIYKKGSNGVHFGHDSNLIARPPLMDKNAVDKNLDAILELNDTGIFNITIAVVPTAFEVLKAKLPDYAYDDRILQITNEIKQKTVNTDIKVCDTTYTLRSHAGEYIYYRTDHHQTALGSYYVYNALSEYLGFEPYKTEDYERKSMTDSFRGTSWSKASLTFQKSDTIERFDLKNAEWLNKVTEFPAEGRSMEGVYAPEHLDTKDKYSVYVDGNHGLTVIRSNSGTGRKLAVFKDSYAHSVAPFLSDSFDEVHMFDLRYYSDDAVRYMGENKITDVVILYNAEGFASDTNLTKLGEFARTSDFFEPPPFGFLPETDEVGDEYFADAAFLGDSLTAGYSYSATIPAQFFCKTSVNTRTVFTEGFNGRSLMESMLSHDELSKYYILLGINEIAFRTVPDFVDGINNIVQAIREKKPDALVYIQSVLPIEHSVEAKTSVKKSKIDEINEGLVRYAEENGCYYLNVNGALAEADGYLRNGAASDGIHVGAVDHAKWESYLKKHAVVSKRKGKAAEAVKLYSGGGNIDLNAFADEMTAGVPFKETLSPVNENVVARILGMQPGDVLNGVFYTSGGATAEEFAAFETETPEQAQAVGEMLKQRVENRKGDFQSYKPEEMPKLNAPVIVVRDNFAAMCVSDDNGAAQTVISHY